MQEGSEPHDAGITAVQGDDERSRLRIRLGQQRQWRCRGEVKIAEARRNKDLLLNRDQ